MSKPIQLNIPQPCQENWALMSQAEKGRFCQSCQQQVVDFTNMTDTQLATFFQQSTSSVCGRFLPGQLERKLETPRKTIPWLRYFFQVALPAFLFTSRANAQGKVMVNTDTITVPNDIRLMGEPLVVTNKDAPERIIKGRVLDTEGHPIQGASVIIKDSRIGTPADGSGYFQLRPGKNNDKCILQLSAVGYETLEIAIDLQKQLDLHDLVLALRMEEIFMGVVVTTKRKSKKETMPLLTQRTMDSLPTRFNVFPNPVAVGASVSIELKKMEEGYYRIELSDLNGNRVFQQKMWIDEEARVIDLGIPSVARGTYLLSLINQVSGKAMTEKVMVN